jgi:hypothetical protein
VSDLVECLLDPLLEIFGETLFEILAAAFSNFVPLSVESRSRPKSLGHYLTSDPPLPTNPPVTLQQKRL